MAAHFGKPLLGQSSTVELSVGRSAVPVTIHDPHGCGMFSCVRITDIVVGPSPPHVRERLRRLGMRAINNVVDASNLVMLELNQPNHAYDAARVSGFRVRTAVAGEELVTLDGVSRSLDANDLLICDQADRPVGLAGVMGGLDSEVTATTTAILLEIAWFAPDPVRFTATRHHLRSEASARFERGVDPEGAAPAAKRFLEIVRETCPGASFAGALECIQTAGLPSRDEVILSDRTIRRTLGVSPEAAKCVSLLSSIGFECRGSEYPFSVRPPAYRPDCVEEIDLVEEIARHLGYETFERRLGRAPGHGHLSPLQARRRLLRQALVGLGLDEAMPNPFLAPGDLARCGLSESEVLRISNPLVAEESVLRTSLRPGLLSAVAHNISHRATRIALWEIGHVYPPGRGQLPDEAEWLCSMVVGADASEALRQWATVADALGVGAQLSQNGPLDGLHPTRSAALTRGKKVIGHVGQIGPRVLREYGIAETVSLFELDLSTVLAEEPKIVMARPLNRHPSSDIDLSFRLGDEVRAGDVARALRQTGGSAVVAVDLLDSYRSPEVGRSLTFRIRLQKTDGTLSEGDIAEIRGSLVQGALKVGASLRV